jgi:molecular chaperone HscB
MNYFELFDIPVQFTIDSSALSKKFFELSRKYHPDYYATASGNEQAFALEKSAHLNKAYGIFKNKDKTLHYILQLKGLLADEEKYELPPTFLMQVMDINEQLMDAKMEGDAAKLTSLKNEISQLETAIYTPVQPIIEQYQDGVTSETALLAVKEYYYKKKYLYRIADQLAGKA